MTVSVQQHRSPAPQPVVMDTPKPQVPSAYALMGKQIFIGGASGAAGMWGAVAPINIKIALQTASKGLPQHEVSKFSYKHLQNMLLATANTLRIFVQDPRRLFTGATQVSLFTFPATAISFSVAKGVENYLSESGKKPLSKGEKMLAAACGGVAGSVVVGPSELLQVVMQEKKMKVFEAASYIYNTYGVKGFFRGIIPTIPREIGFTVSWLAFSAEYPFFTAIGGATATHPSDTLKTRMQANFKYHPIATSDKKEIVARITEIVKVSFSNFIASKPMAGLFARWLAYGGFFSVAVPVEKKMKELLG